MHPPSTHPSGGPMRRLCLLLLGTALGTACALPGSIEPPPLGADGGQPRPAGQPADWDRGVRAAEAAVGRRPGEVEVLLEAAPAEVELTPGVKTRIWAYNGTVPGPLIRAKVGDRVTVAFTNKLPEETTIHWHGIRLPAAMD